MSLQVLREVLSSEYKGPRAGFSEIHVLRAIMVIGANDLVGRGRLGNLVWLGQGEVRTLIKRMKEKDLISIEPGGCRLSEKGEREYRKLREKLPWSSVVRASALGIGEKCWAVLVRGASSNVRKGIEQRDAAVRAGANGALTAVFDSGRFSLPGEGTDCERGGPRELWSSVRAAKPEDDDVLVVVGAGSESVAEVGALAAALTLL